MQTQTVQLPSATLVYETYADGGVLCNSLRDPGKKD